MMFFLQKQGILEDVSNARYLKELRNDIVHEYQFSEIPEMFEEVLRQTPHLLMLCDKGLEEGEALKSDYRRQLKVARFTLEFVPCSSFKV